MAALLGPFMVLIFCVSQAFRDVYFAGVFQQLDFFAVILIAFGLSTVIFGALTAARSPGEFDKLRNHIRTVAAMNVTTALAWSCYFFALKHLEPSIVNTIHSGMAPLTVIALAAGGIRLTRKAEIVSRREYACYGGLALSLLGLWRVVLSGRSGLSGALAGADQTRNRVGRMARQTAKSPIPATLIPGDGIGPEIVAAVKTVLAALGALFQWDEHQAGMTALAATGDPLPGDTLASIRRTRLALKGPLTTPVGGGFRSVNVRLREEFGLYANVRPVRTIVPGGRYDKIDLVLIRENLEGLYVGFEHYIPIGDDPRAVAIGTAVNTKAGAERVIRYAFDYALKNGRKQVTIVHKANVLKATTGLFLEIGQRIAAEYKGRVAANDRIIDACAMQLVLDPWQFDVLVTTNLFGDILSDEMAGLVGGLGLAPGANIGPDAAIFEAVHGSAPDIAGKGVANPVSLLLAAGLMLEHVGRQDLAQRLRAAIDTTIVQDNVRTRDMGGTAGTLDFAAAIARRV